MLQLHHGMVLHVPLVLILLIICAAFVLGGKGTWGQERDSGIGEAAQQMHHGKRLFIGCNEGNLADNCKGEALGPL